MTKPFDGKTAIVTGGTRGIGRAIAKMLLQNGTRVVICGRTEASTQKAVKELADETGGWITGMACDVTKAESIRKFFSYCDDQLNNSLDILVNNAGVGIFRSVGELSGEEWQTVIDTNLTSIFHCCHLAIERFKRGRGGLIVNVASLAGKNAFAGGAAYNASKFGLVGFGEALMLDHRYDNVRVTTIMPGSVSTDFGRGAKADWKIQPEDIAEVVRMAVAMPERTMVSSIEMRPSKPAK